MYKLVPVNSEMSTQEFLKKVAGIFNLKQSLICVSYEFAPDAGEVPEKIEIAKEDENSLFQAISILKDYSKLLVEIRSHPSFMPGISIQDGNRKVCSKEVITEQLKREMGLHDDKGNQKKRVS